MMRHLKTDLIRVSMGFAAAWSCGAAMQPVVVDTRFASDDVVIASLIVKAPADGAADATAAIQGAIDEAAEAGGGVIFLPAGRYLLGGRILLKEGVTLRGDWTPPRGGAGTGGTVIMPVAGRGQAEGPAAITMERGSGLRELVIWYPGQSPRNIVPYPWTICTSPTVTCNNYTVHNVTLVNPYRAIKLGPHINELHVIRHVYGTPLKTGIRIDSTTDIGRLTEVDFSPTWWEQSGFEGSPRSDTARRALREHLLAGAIGVDIGRSDWEYIYRIRITGYGIGLKFCAGERGSSNAVVFGSEFRDCNEALVLEQLNDVGLAATGCIFDARKYAIRGLLSFDTVAQFNSCSLGGTPLSGVFLEGHATVTFQNCSFGACAERAVAAAGGSITVAGCDFEPGGTHVLLGPEISQARILGNRFAGGPRIEDASLGADVMITHHDFAFARPDISPPPSPPDRMPASRMLFDVHDFGAAEAAEDNTGAFADALESAAMAGGGTVYVPPGRYRFGGALNVPAGVELRGCFDVPHHTVSGGSVLMPVGGRGDEAGMPFITLQPQSGLRGVTFWYPEQDITDIHPYPWSIRAAGKDCWITDVTLGNAYQAVDFATHDTSGHVIRYLAGAMFRRGLFVGNCRGEGWIEDVQFNPHYALRLPQGLPHPSYAADPAPALIDAQRRSLEGIVLGSCAREHIRGTFLYAAYDGIKLRGDGGGGPNARIIMHGSDTASRTAVLEAAGEHGVEFNLAQLVPLGKHEVGGIIAPENSRGGFSFFNSQIWAGTLSGRFEGNAEVLLQQLVTHSGPFVFAGGTCRLENARFSRDLAPHVTIGPSCKSARLLANSAKGLFRVDNQAGDRARIRMGSLPRRPPGGDFALTMGWEPGEHEPIEDTISPGGEIRSVRDSRCRRTREDARTGDTSLKISGIADDPVHSYVYFETIKGPFNVAFDTTLRYAIKPLTELGRHVGIDLIFTGGRMLRHSHVETIDGQGAFPGHRKGPVGEWDQIVLPLGRQFAGQTIESVLFAYDRRGKEGRFEALIDDVALESCAAQMPWQATANPPGGAHRTGVSVALTSQDGLPLRYTLDGRGPAGDAPIYAGPIRLDTPGLHEIRFAVEDQNGAVSPWIRGAVYDITPNE